MDFHRYGPLQNRQTECHAASFTARHSNSFHAIQGAVSHPHPFAAFEKRAGLQLRLRVYGRLQRPYFAVIEWKWHSPYSHHVHHAGNRQQGKSVLDFEAAEDVSGEKRHVERL